MDLVTKIPDINNTEEMTEVAWSVEIPWKIRKQILKDKIISLGAYGAEYDIEKLLMVLFENNCIKNLTEEQFYNTPLAHLYMFGNMMVVYLQTGKLNVNAFYEALENDKEVTEQVPL